MFKNIFGKIKVLDHQAQLKEWEKNGRTGPSPHLVKQKLIEEFKNRFNTEILVETGTYLGEMIEAQLNNFIRIYSIELSKRLFRRATTKFNKYPHIRILLGDSGIILKNLMTDIDKPALFWLDGHYSHGITAKGDKECPVKEELATIFKYPLSHIILIDDARLFNGTNDYPTLEEIKNIIDAYKRKYRMEIQNDIICLTPIEN